ncbi:type II CRISPR RNA-guided endonuclease Cas9 [Rothia sp. CCM 9416]|uniref:type II CRISPR RNA-guided endonuclease Cas9 n=1 Tax=Rothia sp. CCM 9416 TaxID=3402655 RepID=UPI003AEE79BC
MMQSEALKYRIGVDVGDRSVGLAAIEFDDAGYPIKKLALVTYRHDGGLDPTQNKSPKSRKETAGVARRVRRMRRRRVQRLKKLDATLTSLGYPVPAVEEPQTYQAWFSRAKLTSQKIDNEVELAEHLVRALRHMARHRGWRNPWWRLSQLDQAPVPSVTMLENLEQARLRWPDYITDNTTVGEIGALAASKDVLLRPRTSDKRKNGLHHQGQKALLDSRVRQEDLLAEVKKMWAVQGLPQGHYHVLVEALFDQMRPHVPAQNVGRDPLPGRGNLPRAPRACLEFTEFRIRQAVRNLRVRQGSQAIELSIGQYMAAVNYLMNFSEAEPPTWGDVAEAIGVEPHALIAPVIDDVRLNKAPYDHSSFVLLKALPKSSQVVKWWQTADVSLRSLLIMLLSDPTEFSVEAADECGLSAVFESWPEKEREKLEGLDFESGRAAYSVQSLTDLNSYMAEHQTDLHTARKAVFGVDDSWQPPRENLHEPTGQPAVDRVLTIVRRFVLACERKWGRPDRIVIEHARTGLMGPTQRAEVLREIARNRTENDRVRQELRDSGELESPTRADVRRHRIVQNQGCKCLYCGAMITTKTAELDHIVPRAGGGSSRVDNLVAVCRGCNADKGRVPFAVWAARTTRSGVSLEEALGRLWEFDKVGVFKGVSGRRLKEQIARRLKQKEEDPPIDERSLESTAYSAVSVRHRLETYFNAGTARSGGDRVHIDVYSGSLTRQSRRAGQIDEQILLRGQEEKNRFDVRHHAIDAAVMTLLNPSVARTLEQRRLLLTERRYSSRDNDWKDFTGLDSPSQQKFHQWKETCQALADVLGEAISEDSIPVINPLRLTPANGSVHKDTLLGLEYKLVGDEWSAGDIDKVADPYLYLALQEQLGKQKVLEADSNRYLRTERGHQLTAQEQVVIFPEKAASILAGTGAVKIGDSLHHARLYAWHGKKGIEVGMLRVFGAEFPWLFKLYGTRDALRVPIHAGSQSYRDLQGTVRKQIEAGKAQEIGWITQGDELEIEVDSFVDGSDKFAQFLRIIPESRWKVDGLPMSRQLRLRPLLLSYEELPQGIYTDEELALVQEILEKGAIVSAGGVLSAHGTKVIRRNHLGFPRWRENGAVPVSLDIERRAQEVLGA